jgi:cobalamin biosynthesis protein CobD/CbiB
MAAMAGALRVRLEKSGHYVLGEGPEPSADDISIAVRTVIIAALGASAVMMVSVALLRWLSS